MTTPQPEPAPPSRRPSTGWIVLGGSVLASAIWWVLTPAPRGPAPAATVAPAPADAGPAHTAAPSPGPAVTSRPRAMTPGTAEEPPPASAPPRGAAGPLLRVRGDVDGADVFVDRTFVGKTPFETRDITAGSHQINVSAEGHDGISQRVEVAPDSPTDVSFALKAVVLNAAVAVVHKHRLGSCEGRLSADPGGIRYAPTSGDDAFHAPLSNLEAFAVDYQAKELRLKVRSGRSFNFTTKTKNADPLLVFHRDVEKARRKLAGGA